MTAECQQQRKVYVASYYADGKRRFPTFGHMLAQWPAGSRFTTTDDPADADWILFMEGDGGDHFRALREHVLLKQYFERCYVYGQVHDPLYPLPGVYTSLSRRQVATGRYRPFCYLPLGPGIDNDCLHDQGDLERPRRYVFSFVGAASSWPRRRLFRIDFGRPDIRIEDTSAIRHTYWAEGASDEERKQSRQRYAEIMHDSEFVLCPRGYGLGSIRLFETMQMGRVPVVIADRYAFPEGPDWDAFCIVIPERCLRDIPAILEPYRERHRDMGRAAREAWRTCFRPERQLERLCEELDQVAQQCWRDERFERGRWSVCLPAIRMKIRLRILARQLLLGAYKVSGRRCPYSFIPR